jgi:hypothetical protein
VRTDRHADCGGDTCSCAVVNILERKMEWLAFVRLPGMLAARLELYSRELKIKVLVKKLKCLDQGLKSAANLLQIYYRELEIKVLVKKRPVQWRIEICCKSITGLKKFFFFF